jgi:hypothetical protein
MFMSRTLAREGVCMRWRVEVCITATLLTSDFSSGESNRSLIIWHEEAW